MENYSYGSYPDSVNSSPRSRENSSWEADDSFNASSNYKVKLLCSYGGQIQPRPHDNQLTYLGGDTKILAVDRHIKFKSFLFKLSSLCVCDATDVSFKYQLPGEDLDALISVTNDEDLDHMMLEYDRLCKASASAKPARLRLFVFKFPLTTSSFGSDDSKSEQQWFVDALNSVHLEGGSSPSSAAATNNPDYLFGLDKGQGPPDVEVKVQNEAPAPPVNEGYAGTEPAEFQRQIEDLQRLQISTHDRSPRVYGGEYSVLPPHTAVPVSAPAAYRTERQVASGPYPTAPPTEQPVYFMQTPAGIYQAPAMRPVTGQVGHGYYGMQRAVPEVYREQPVYNPIPHPTSAQQQPKYGGPHISEAVKVVRAPPEVAYAQVSYDGAGRQVYYSAPLPYQAVAAASGSVDVRQSGGAFIAEGKIITKVSQTSST